MSMACAQTLIVCRDELVRQLEQHAPGDSHLGQCICK